MIALRPIVLLLLMAGLAACSPKPSTPTPAPATSAKPESKPKEPASPLDIGDFESTIRIVPVVGAQSAGPNVHVDEMKDNQSRVLMATASVAPPFPPQFWVTFRLEGVRAVERAPVAVRVKVMRDKHPIAAFSAFFDPVWFTKPFEQSFDVLAGLSSTPPTLLIHAEAELVMLPPGTDTTKADPNTATGPPDMTGVVLGSPMRIDFGSGVAAP